MLMSLGPQPSSLLVDLAVVYGQLSAFLQRLLKRDGGRGEGRGSG